MRRSPILALALAGCVLDFDTKGTATDPTPSDWTPTVPTTSTSTSTPTFGDTGDSGFPDDTGGGGVTTSVPGNCAARESWRDALPPLPPRAAVVDPLPAGAGLALATCTGQGTYDSAPGGEWVTLDQSHVGGQWYFEIEAKALAGAPEIGLYAHPSDEWSVLMLGPIWNAAEAVAGVNATRATVYSVAADLDAGHVWFYEAGSLVHDADVLLIPGVGAFSPAMITNAGDRLTFNDGTDPFAYEPPPGFSAWAGGAAGGRCPDDADVPAPPAPVDLFDGARPVQGATTYLTDATAPNELVVLGAYDSDSVSNWTWGPAGPVVIGGGRNGAARVEIDRPGVVDLVLTTYEPTDWELVVDPATTLASVSVYAMHPQTVTGLAAGVPLEIHTICADGNGGWCTAFTGENFPVVAYSWPYDTGGGDTQGLVARIERDRCLPMKVFAGGYNVTRYVVH